MSQEQEQKHKKLEEMGFVRGDAQGRKIEYDREVWAARRSARFSEERVDLALISKVNEDFLNLPLLGSENFIDAASWVPRVHPITGAVYTTRWGKPKIDEKNFEEYIAIGGKKYRENIDLVAIPLSWRLGVLIPQRVEDGIEAAIRQQEEIRGDYDARAGVEQQRVETVLLGIYSLTESFLQGKMTDGKLKGLAKKAEQMLKKEGLVNINDTSWERIVDYTKRAAEKDSLGRINPQRSRILARAAYLRAVEREVETRLVREKSSKVLTYLEVAKIETRMNLKSAMNSLSTLAGLGKDRGAAIFREGDAVTSKDALGISVVLRGVIDSYFKPVKAAPYLYSARAAQALLFGNYYMSNQEENIFCETLSAGGMEGVLNLKPAEHFLRNKDPKNAYVRIRMAHSLIESTLQDLK